MSLTHVPSPPPSSTCPCVHEQEEAAAAASYLCQHFHSRQTQGDTCKDVRTSCVIVLGCGCVDMGGVGGGWKGEKKIKFKVSKNTRRKLFSEHC